MNERLMRAVLDCMVFAQALINPDGPAGECVVRGSGQQFTIVLSPQVLAEILELPQKLPVKYCVTDAKVIAFLDELMPTCLMIEHVPHVFAHPIDPDDSVYVDLALAAGARMIVSRDRHLLGLNNPEKPWSATFRQRFPDLRVLTVEELLGLLHQQGLK